VARDRSSVIPAISVSNRGGGQRWWDRGELSPRPATAGACPSSARASGCLPRRNARRTVCNSSTYHVCSMRGWEPYVQTEGRACGWVNSGHACSPVYMYMILCK
jgi:hypothetical protein